jgi:hypothetical protein
MRSQHSVAFLLDEVTEGRQPVLVMNDGNFGLSAKVRYHVD